ncbi:MAG TPA: chlorophyllase, partial [Micromonosporaceae bacterium]
GSPAVAPGAAPRATGSTPASAAPAPSRAAVEPSGTAPRHPFAVGVRKLSLNRGGARPLPVTIWYPRAAAGRTAAAPGRFPVVVFSHGLTGLPDDYAPLLSAWAAAGFVVAAPAYPHTSRGAPQVQVLDVINQPADASYVLTQVLALDRKASDPLRGHLDVERVAAAGHSAGGITTLGLFTVERDPRLDAGIVLSGSALGVGTAFSGPAAPQLFVHGQLDDVISYAAGKAAYDAVPWPKAMLSLPDGDHGRDLMHAGNPAFGVVAGTTVEFLRWTLYRDPAAKRRLPASAARGGLARLDDHL